MPTDWELRYQSHDTPWDKGAPHPELVQWLSKHAMTGKVLVPGCGLGHDVRALAASADEVLGIDVAPSAIAEAKKFPEVGGESYKKADFFNLGVGLKEHFDWVWEQTCFCAIDPQRRPDYVRAVVTALKPDGHLLACFYIDPGLDPGESGPPFGVSQAELREKFSASFELLEQWVPTKTFPGREGRELMQLLRKKSSACPDPATS
jgi:SAM-dependent methyltransferase